MTTSARAPSKGLRGDEDAPEGVRERDADLVRERAVDDGEVGGVAVENAAARRRVEVPERRVDDPDQARLEEAARRLKRAVERREDADDGDGEVEEACTTAAT